MRLIQLRSRGESLHIRRRCGQATVRIGQYKRKAVDWLRRSEVCCLEILIRTWPMKLEQGRIVCVEAASMCVLRWCVAFPFGSGLLFLFRAGKAAYIGHVPSWPFVPTLVAVCTTFVHKAAYIYVRPIVCRCKELCARQCRASFHTYMQNKAFPVRDANKIGENRSVQGIKVHKKQSISNIVLNNFWDKRKWGVDN